jgi:hypothetical protein
MVQALPCLVLCLVVSAASAESAMAGRGGLGLGWLAPDGARDALALAAPQDDRDDPQLEGRAAPDPPPGLPLPVAAPPVLPPAPAAPPVPVLTEADSIRRAALGAAFNADLLSRRRANAQDHHAAPPWEPRFQGQGVAGLRDLIASVEAGKKGYDAIHLSARALPARRPTDLTIDEIQAWVRATPGQQHAIGRYQFIPKTLAMLVGRLDIPATARFTPDLQDRLADELLADAGLAEFKAGRIDRAAFMSNLARIWAGLPTASGKSHYHGLAGNAAGMSWAAYDRHMAALFPVPVVFAGAGKSAR